MIMYPGNPWFKQVYITIQEMRIFAKLLNDPAVTPESLDMAPEVLVFFRGRVNHMLKESEAVPLGAFYKAD